MVALGGDGFGARPLSRLTRKSWDQLGLAEGAPVYAQVKAVALGRFQLTAAATAVHTARSSARLRPRAALVNLFCV